MLITMRVRSYITALKTAFQLYLRISISASLHSLKTLKKPIPTTVLRKMPTQKTALIPIILLITVRLKMMLRITVTVRQITTADMMKTVSGRIIQGTMVSIMTTAAGLTITGITVSTTIMAADMTILTIMVGMVGNIIN